MDISDFGRLVGRNGRGTSAGQGGEGALGQFPGASPLWDTSADFAGLDQQEPGHATVRSLVEEANLLLDRLSAVDLHRKEGMAGAEISLHDGDGPLGSLSPEDRLVLLEKVRLLQRLLTGDTPSSGLITPN